MLTKISVSQAGSATAKQIVLKPAASSQVVYTVPEGKTFTGEAIAMSQMDFDINGVVVFSQASAPTSSWHRFPLKLVAGSVIKCGPSYSNWTLLGIEE